MKILLTGATGFIGKNILENLSEKYNFFLLLRPGSEIPDKYSGSNNVFIFKDNIEELSNFLAENDIEGIVHLASLYITQHTPEDIKDLILSNVYLGCALLESAKKAGVKWFINTGTFWQHYVPDSREYNPVNLYAATKQAFIDLAKFYKESAKINFVTLKICDTYGKNDTRSKILNLFKRISDSGEALNMSPGHQKINLLYIDDVIMGFEKLIEIVSNHKILKDEFVLSAKKNYSLRELASIYERITHKKLNIIWGGKPYREREIMEPWEMGKCIPGWKPKFSISKGIREFLSF